MSELQDTLDAVPFARALGIELTAAAADEVRGRLAWAPDRCTAGGVLHGGALMSFADTLGAVCAFLNLPAGASTGTIESKTNFLRPVREGEVEGVARPVHVGRTTIVVQTEARDPTGTLVSLTTQTQAVLPAARGPGASR
ncbi:MAG TPA: PaaI family thioesterase [Gaiellaceae bacterium]|nr:PaaI family thioesterase [Gaiellaceae bacterium]